MSAGRFSERSGRGQRRRRGRGSHLLVVADLVVADLAAAHRHGADLAELGVRRERGATVSAVLEMGGVIVVAGDVVGTRYVEP